MRSRFQAFVPVCSTLSKRLRLSVDQTGDTLLEVLITIVIISLAAAALLGALTTSITSSSEHRSLSSVDTLLRGVAESAKDQIQRAQPSAAFQDNCSADYGSLTFSPPPANYKVTLSPVHFWNPTNKDFADGSAACAANGDNTTIQLITLSATAPNNVSDTMSFVVTNPAFVNPTPPATVSVSFSPAQPVPGAAITFTATVAPPSGAGPAPSGNVQWNFDASSPASCASLAPLTPNGTSSTATCPVGNVQNGDIFSGTATYLGDNNYKSSTSLRFSVTVMKATPTLTVTGPATSPVNQPVTFTATISGPTGDPAPTGAVTWTLTPPGTTCTPVNTPTGNTLASTCMFSPAVAGTYTATVSIGADPGYNAAGPSPTPPASVTVS